jgi:formamidopyrimidine-DNA glycosylase
MPEGPEASFLAHYINKHFQHETLTNINIVKGRYINHGPPPNFSSFVRALPLKCTNIDKKGKVIFFHFEKGWCLISKLGMSGWWYTPGNEPDWKPVSPNVNLKFGRNKDLLFSDTRNYGTMTITQDPAIIQEEYDKLAPDILQKSTNVNGFHSRLTVLQNKPSFQTKLMEDVVMEQKLLLSGLGNYLKAEVLYAAQISPLRKVGDVTLEEWTKFFKCAKTISRKMYDILLSAESGNKYLGAMKVYHHSFDPYGNPVHTHSSKTGRTTWWVPAVQK